MMGPLPADCGELLAGDGAEGLGGGHELLARAFLDGHGAEVVLAVREVALAWLQGPPAV